jgi:hypothetical protein
MKILKKLAIVVASVALGTPAFALTCTGTLFTMAAGTISTSGYTDDAAKACVTLTGSTITVVLENQTGTVSQVPDTLVGFSFTLAGGGSISSGITGATSGIGDANGQFLDCNVASLPCTYENTFHSYDNGGTATVVGSPYTWAATTGVTTVSGGSFHTFSTTNPGLFAGQGSGNDFSLHPGGIVNDSAANNAAGGLLNNKPHNDLLLSDTSFTLTCTGCTSQTTFSSGVFYWGTEGLSGSGGGGNITGTVPEPTSIALLGGVLLFTVRTLRRKRSQA